MATSKATRKSRETADYEAVRLRFGTSCETSDRGRSSTSFTRGWKPSCPRYCPRARSARRSSTRLNHWEALEASPGGRVPPELDNEARASLRVQAGVEALGRKNWLFAGSDRGGQTAAVLMSLCATCKDMGIDPRGLPPRCAGPHQHPSGAADRRVAAGPLAGVAPGRRRCKGLTAPEPRVRHHPRRARGDCARRAPGLSRPAFVSAPRDRVRRPRCMNQDGAPNIIPHPKTVLKVWFTGRTPISSNSAPVQAWPKSLVFGHAGSTDKDAKPVFNAGSVSALWLSVQFFPNRGVTPTGRMTPRRGAFREEGPSQCRGGPRTRRHPEGSPRPSSACGPWE